MRLPSRRFRRGWTLGLLSIICLNTACTGASKTLQGGVGGGLIGAGAGAALGSLTGNAGKGAAIGAGIGTLTGMLAGNDLDQEEKRAQTAQLQQARAELAAQAQPPLGLTDVARLASQGVSDDVIIAQMRATRSTYTLSAADIEWLKQNHVSDRVLRAMIESRTTAAVPPPPVVHSPAPPRVIYTTPPPVYVIERPFPPPLPPVGFGFSYTRIR